jgi:acetylornithine aminotransferase
VLIHPDIKPWSGMLGTTFGGNYLACAASLAVLEVMEKERLLENAVQQGNILMDALKTFTDIQAVRGRGLMIGFDLAEHNKQVRENLLMKHRVFTGEAKPNTIRLLPSLAITKNELQIFITALQYEIK